MFPLGAVRPGCRPWALKNPIQAVVFRPQGLHDGRQSDDKTPGLPARRRILPPQAAVRPDEILPYRPPGPDGVQQEGPDAAERSGAPSSVRYSSSSCAVSSRSALACLSSKIGLALGGQGGDFPFQPAQFVPLFRQPGKRGGGAVRTAACFSRAAASASLARLFRVSSAASRASAACCRLLFRQPDDFLLFRQPPAGAVSRLWRRTVPRLFRQAAAGRVGSACRAPAPAGTGAPPGILPGGGVFCRPPGSVHLQHRFLPLCFQRRTIIAAFFLAGGRPPDFGRRVGPAGPGGV